MINLIFLVLKNRKYLQFFKYGVFALIVLGAFGFGFFKGYYSAKHNIESKTKDEVISIEKKQNIIRNNRPDDAVLFKRLRSGKI